MNKTTSLTIAIALGSVAFFGCSERNRDKVADTADSMYQNTKDAVSDSWDSIKDYSYEKKSDFVDRSKAVSADLEAKVSKLQADYAESKASASRKAAMNELKDANADFKDKMSALGDASADTWGAAKADVIHAWDRVEAAYKKAVADAS